MHLIPEDNIPVDPERVEWVKSNLEFVLNEVCYGVLNLNHTYIYFNQDTGLHMHLQPTDVANRMSLQIQYFVDLSVDEKYSDFDINGSEKEHYIIDFSIKS